MLKNASLFRGEVEQRLLNIFDNNRYKYYFTTGYYCVPDFHTDEYYGIERVSYDDIDGVVGLFTASINRTPRYVSNISAINFENTDEQVFGRFGRDLVSFIDLLFVTYDFEKIVFNVVVGNPIERMYDKLIKRYNGSVVGTYRNHRQTPDGKTHDSKAYELFKTDYIYKIKEL